MSDADYVSRFWQDAAAILETATSTGQADQSDLAILVDDANGIRIVDGTGWNVEALREQYAATTAYCIKRTSTGVTVDARSGQNSCTLKKTRTYNPLASLSATVPHHLIAPSAARLLA